MLRFIKEFIKRLGEENMKPYGNQRLECCNLNKDLNKITTNKNK